MEVKTRKEKSMRYIHDSFMQEYKQASEMEKVYVKKFPNLIIEDNITYL